MPRLPLAVPLLALTALLAGCGGTSDSTPAAGTGTGTAEGPATAQTFTVRGTDADAFSPATVLAKVGRLTLSMTTGGVPHDLAFADKALPGISVVSSGTTKSTVLTLDRAGTYTFTCTLHAGMSGKLVVG